MKLWTNQLGKVKELVVQPPGAGWVCATALAAPKARNIDLSMAVVVCFVSKQCSQTSLLDKVVGDDNGLMGEAISVRRQGRAKLQISCWLAHMSRCRFPSPFHPLQVP